MDKAKFLHDLTMRYISDVDIKDKSVAELFEIYKKTYEELEKKLAESNDFICQVI